MLKFPCPACQQKLNVSPKLAGKFASCPKCGKRLQVPTDTPENPRSTPEQTTQQPDQSLQNVRCENDPPAGSEEFPDISEFLAPDEIIASLPAQKRSSKNPRVKSSSANQLRSSEMECQGCGKVMAKSDRYCVACGFNHFDAVETAVATQQKMHDRLERQVGGLFLWQWLRFFSRFFR